MSFIEWKKDQSKASFSPHTHINITSISSSSNHWCSSLAYRCLKSGYGSRLGKPFLQIRIPSSTPLHVNWCITRCESMTPECMTNVKSVQQRPVDDGSGRRKMKKGEKKRKRNGRERSRVWKRPPRVTWISHVEGKFIANYRDKLIFGDFSLRQRESGIVGSGTGTGTGTERERRTVGLTEGGKLYLLFSIHLE